jgi:hypothetical protein
LVLLPDVQLPAGDLAGLDAAWLSMEGAHIVDEAACDRGRQFYRFEADGSEIGTTARDCESDLAGSGLRMGGAGTAWPLHRFGSVEPGLLLMAGQLEVVRQGRRQLLFVPAAHARLFGQPSSFWRQQ